MAEHDSIHRMKNRADKVKGKRPLVKPSNRWENNTDTLKKCHMWTNSAPTGP